MGWIECHHKNSKQSCFFIYWLVNSIYIYMIDLRCVIPGFRHGQTVWPGIRGILELLGILGILGILRGLAFVLFVGFIRFGHAGDAEELLLHRNLIPQEVQHQIEVGIRIVSTPQRQQQDSPEVLQTAINCPQVGWTSCVSKLRNQPVSSFVCHRPRVKWWKNFHSIQACAFDTSGGIDQTCKKMPGLVIQRFCWVQAKDG